MTAFPFDTNPNEPIKLGLIVLSSDETIEDEFRARLPKSCSLFHTRIHSAPEVTPDTLMEMKAGLAASPRVRNEYACETESMILAASLETHPRWFHLNSGRLGPV